MSSERILLMLSSGLYDKEPLQTYSNLIFVLPEKLSIFVLSVIHPKKYIMGDLFLTHFDIPFQHKSN